MSPAGLTTTEPPGNPLRSEEHTSELQSQSNLVCRLLLEKKKNNSNNVAINTNATTAKRSVNSCTRKHNRVSPSNSSSTTSTPHSEGRRSYTRPESSKNPLLP